MSDKRFRGWCLTVFFEGEDPEPTRERLRAFYESSKLTYLVSGLEKAPTTGTLHFQTYVFFPEAITQSSLLKRLSKLDFDKKPHVASANGNPQQNRTYCVKDGEFIELGELPQSGKRNDLERITDVVKTGGGMRAVLDTGCNYQCVKHAEVLLKYFEKPRDYKPEVYWLWGESGSGKTRRAYELSPEVWRKSNTTGKWFDGYDAHDDVLLDDIKDCSQAMYSMLLELLDRYECKIETKGGMRQFRAKRIFVTSLQNPSEMYKEFNQCVELLRRIDHLIEMFKDSGTTAISS